MVRAAARTAVKPKVEEKASSRGSPTGTRTVTLVSIAGVTGECVLACSAYYASWLSPRFLYRPHPALGADGGSIARELRELKGLLKK